KAIRIQNLTPGTRTADILRYRTPRLISRRTVSQSSRRTFDEQSGCPLTESQMNVYLDLEAKGKKGAYLIPFKYRLPSGKTAEDARKALDEVIASQPALRGRIAMAEDGPRMLFDSRPTVSDSLPDSIDVNACMSAFSVSDEEIRGLISHLAFDGMSSAILSEQLTDALDGIPQSWNGGVLRTAEAEADYRRSGYEAAEAFFGAMLGGADCETGMLPDREGTFGTVEKAIPLPMGRISSKAGSMGSTAGAFLASAFGYTLSRFTGRSDAVFCVLDNGRDSPEVDRTVGMFVRTVPVRMDCSDRGIPEFISESSKTVYEATSHGRYPFRKLSESYGVGSDTLFQYIPGEEAASLERDLTGADPRAAGLISDLTVMVGDLPGGPRIYISHSDKYSDATAERLADAFARIVEGMTSCDRLSEISLISESDLEIVGRINDTSKALECPCLVQAFRESVSRYPERAAVSYDGRSVTYSEADAVTDGIAAKLTEMGVKAGDDVAVLVPRSEWYFLSAIGVLKTGAAYVPMDDAYPDERLSFMAGDSGVAVTLVTPETAGRAAAMGLKTIDCASCVRKTFEPVEIDPASPAVILYTSGTTG
ncbi:MAG: AMP-binding protein, partial [Candidatus Methanomethylophilaceae archaeon]|nr:AMP-binding protein [Candidatus Methanomethylophilaceae archaeon]